MDGWRRAPDGAWGSVVFGQFALSAGLYGPITMSGLPQVLTSNFYNFVFLNVRPLDAKIEHF